MIVLPPRSRRDCGRGSGAPQREAHVEGPVFPDGDDDPIDDHLGMRLRPPVDDEVRVDLESRARRMGRRLEAGDADSGEVTRQRLAALANACGRDRCRRLDGGGVGVRLRS